MRRGWKKKLQHENAFYFIYINCDFREFVQVPTTHTQHSRRWRMKRAQKIPSRIMAIIFSRTIAQSQGRIVNKLRKQVALEECNEISQNGSIFLCNFMWSLLHYTAIHLTDFHSSLSLSRSLRLFQTSKDSTFQTDEKCL